MPRAVKQKLRFNEKLVQTGKGGGADALLRRLKTLFQELVKLDQEQVDIKSLGSVRVQLVQRVIVFHKDRGVKAFAACCLAELLRLYAPDAPYTADELRDIFQFFIAQIVSGLKGHGSKAPMKKHDSQATQQTQTQTQGTQGTRITDAPYYTEYCHLIESLAQIKSVVIIVDLPSADDLITRYFEGVCEIARADMNKSLLRNLVSILVELLLESERAPSGVMDVIIKQFETYGSKPDTPSFQLIADVCNRMSVKVLPPAVLAHFSDIQMTHGRDPSPADLQTLKESHELVLTMFRNAPSLLVNIIPVLEENLRAVEEVPLRQLSTETLGTMFGERPIIGKGVESYVVLLAKAYPATWRAWLGRKVDKALAVRLAWVQATGKIIANQPDLRSEVEADLVERVQDSDERVRAAICKVLGSLSYETALHHVSDQLLHAVGGRVSDKKPLVRNEAISSLAKLWSLAYDAIESNEEDAIDHFGWIPQEMLHAIFRKDVTVDLRSQVNAAFKNVILPLPPKPDDEQAWVDRFLLVASQVDESAIAGLERLTGLKGYAKGSSPYAAFAEACDEFNGGTDESVDKRVKTRLAYIMEAISRMLFNEHEKARKDLEAFAAANDKKLYKLLRSMADPQSNLRTIIKARNEFLRRVEQSHSSLLDVLSVVVDHAAWVIINQSSIPCLIRRLQKPDGPNAERVGALSARFLTLVAKECAPMYKDHIDELKIVLNDRRNNALVEVAIQALAAVTKWNPECGPTDKKVIERAMALALSGTPRQAKFASRFISVCSDGNAPQRLVDSLWDQLQSGDEQVILPTLSSLAELALSASVAFRSHGDDIVQYIQEDVMLRPSEDETEDDKWAEEEQLPVRDRAKIYGIKLLTHNALPWCKLPDALDHLRPVLALLNDLTKNEGRVTDDTNEGGMTRCHLRLCAACSILKLANVRLYDKAMSESFVNVSFILQDVNFTVRNLFLKKLFSVVPSQRLLPRWNALPAFAAQDPEMENIILASTIIRASVNNARKLRDDPDDMKDRIEVPLARLLHLLTQHPDLGWSSLNELKDIAKFIELYVECVATSQNVTLLFTVVAKLKTVCVVGEQMGSEKVSVLLSDRPLEDDDDERHTSATYHLYMLSELAQMIIRNRAHAAQWNLTMYPGKVRLPNDIFANLPSVDIQQKMARHTFLSEDVQAWAKSFGRRTHMTAQTRRARPTSPTKEPRKRRRPSNKSPRKRRRRSRQDEDDDDDETSDEETTDDDEADVDMVSTNEAETEEEEEEEETNGAEAVVGRGGRRSAKTKANKAVTRKAKRAPKKKPARRSVTESESDLTELSDG
ncbi:hypothetical protein CspeluHIS016_0104610 [Cutaneotrichosporon spelunceum]|uniref:ARM repeat-containing protein n=1 Tax=Cutaneotrichosporon spelunceum TaxID=1672016 RepID=A0AAD3TP82_9TREE|nr:hypothetical protein CspeluHIS016_0104610 [Cutaneotrichosporon spelunceum]